MHSSQICNWLFIGSVHLKETTSPFFYYHWYQICTLLFLLLFLFCLFLSFGFCYKYHFIYNFILFLWNHLSTKNFAIVSSALDLYHGNDWFQRSIILNSAYITSKITLKFSLYNTHIVFHYFYLLKWEFLSF